MLVIAILFVVLVRMQMMQVVTARGFSGSVHSGPTQAVTKPSVGAKIILFRPLKRAGDVLTFPQPQSLDWGYLMPPAEAG